MNTIAVTGEIVEFVKGTLPSLADVRAIEYAQSLTTSTRAELPLERLKSHSMAIVLLAQTLDSVSAILTERLELVEAVNRSIALRKTAAIEQAWNGRAKKRIATLKQLDSLIPEFTKSFRSQRDHLRADIRLRLDEFQGDVAQYVSTEFVLDNSNLIFGLNEKLTAGLCARAAAFAQSVSPSLVEFCLQSADRVSAMVGTRISTPVHMEFNCKPGDFGFVEDQPFEKIMGINSALRVGDMNMDVVGLGVLGKWLAIAKAPQHVREQYARKNSTQVRNFGRQFAADLLQTVKLNLDRLDLFLVSQLDAAQKGNRVMVGFLQAKAFSLPQQPGKLNLQKIAALDTMRFVHALGRASDLRASLNVCYRQLSENEFKVQK